MSTADTIQTVILVANFFTLFVLWLSVRGARNASFATVYQGLASQMHDIDKFFVQNPELRGHFYSNAQLPAAEPELGRVLAIAEMIVDFADNFAAQSRSLEGYQQGWAEYFQFVYTQSPALRVYWKDNAAWYHDDLKKMFGEAEKRLAPNLQGLP